MLRSTRDIEGYGIVASDGHVGRVQDFLVDDETWVIRYMVVDCGYLSWRRVLISPMAFGEADWTRHEFQVLLSREKIKNSPSIDAHQPVSRQHEFEYNRYYGYPHYWAYSNMWGTGAYPSMAAAGMVLNDPAAIQSRDKIPADVHLRSVREISSGYHVQGVDDPIGHVHDFIVDDESWAIRYLVIDTSNWWIGKKVLVAPQWASHVSWPERKVSIDLTRKAIQNSPQWNASQPVNREYETRLYDYFGRPVYWDGEAQPAHPPSPMPEHRPQ